MKRDAAPAAGFRPLAMQLRNDCGPTALLQALEAYGRPRSVRFRSRGYPTWPRSVRFRSRGYPTWPLDRDELLRLWRFREGADRLDTPGHHLRILRKLGIPAAMRRRLGRREIARAVRAGRPVVLLVPVGAFRWHWVVVCGVEGDGAVVSRGDGELVTAPWSGLVPARPRALSERGAVDGPPNALVTSSAGAGPAKMPSMPRSVRFLSQDRALQRCASATRDAVRAAAGRTVGGRLLDRGYPTWPSRLTGGRALRVDGLGYCLGRPFPFAPDRALERDMLRLASLAEEALAVTEPALRAARAVLERLARLARP